MTTTLQPAIGPEAPSKKRSLKRFERYSPIAATVVLLIVMLAFGGIRYDNFLSGQALLDLFNKNSYLFVLAIGMTFVILTGGIDLSVGAVMAMGTVIAAQLLSKGWSPALVIPVVLVISTVLGLLVGLMIDKFKIQPFIATLAAMFLARGLSLMITDRQIAITDTFFQKMNLTHINLWETTTNTRRGVRVSDVYTTWSVVIALLILVIAFVVLHYTRFGRTVYAIGGGESSANLMGLAVARTKISVYAISGLCSGLAGILYSFYTASGDPIVGVGYELNAIAAVVIGGTLLAGGAGYVLGSVLGVITLSVIYAYKDFDGGLNTGWTRVMIGALVLLFIVLQRVLVARRK
ncbi:sugar ABC transporter permease YjfF [Nakamurella silvestris]|nr:sugar ABC transporter permease YjfF [Nakamurella silvestris]